MAELPSTARVVVIGGGSVGTSCLYHLALAGWTDCLLLEKNELTSGSTWHAAGNVPTFSASWSIMNMQRYSAELFRGLADRVDYPMNYHVTGSLRLAHSRNRMLEFERVRGMGRYQGMDIEIVGPDDIRDKYPFIETHDLAGALYDPYDGDIDPAQLTQALAKGARDLGARIVRFCPVTGVRWDGREWTVETPQGAVRAEYVVNAAGYRAREVGKMFGRDIPGVSMSHQYILFEEVPEVRDWSEAAGRKLPLLRDVDTSYYLRQEKFGFNLGPYERNCRAHWVTPDDPMPDDFSFQLWPDDLDRLEFQLEDAMARVPALATAGISRVINGPIPYLPDGNPNIGPMPGVPNAFEACVFTFGICQAGGAGKVLAEWVTERSTEWDMWSCDPRRFTGWVDQEYAVAKAKEVYGHEYAMHFPHHAWPAGRPKRLSPVHDRVTALGGQMGAFNGWERALWYARPGDDTSEAATETWGRAGPWEPRVRAECEAVRDGCGVLDLPGFSRFMVRGEGAAAWLEGLISGRVPSVGRIGLAYFADARGRIVTEMSIMRLAEAQMMLITAATAEWHDREWLERHLPAELRHHDRGRYRGVRLPDRHGARLARGAGPDHRWRPLETLADAPVGEDRRGLGAACPRLVRRRAGLGGALQGRRNAGGLGRDNRRRRRALRHVGTGQPANRERVSHLEGRPLDRLHAAAGRARPLHPLGQARFCRQGSAVGGKAARRDEALRADDRRGWRLRRALHVDRLEERRGGGRDDLRGLGLPRRRLDRAGHRADRLRRAGHAAGGRDLRRTLPGHGAARRAAVGPEEREDPRMNRIVLLDGGMGQELIRRSSRPAHPQWSAHVMIHEPEIVQAVHEDYLRAGARVITLNSYSTTPGRFRTFGIEDQFERLQRRAIELAHAARDAVGREARIAGCLPPLVGSYHPELLPPEDELLAEYRQIAAIEAPEVDLFLCETMSKAGEARAAATAAAETGRPVWVAWTLSETLAPDGTARLRSGETIAQAIATLDGLPVEALLVNCCPPEVVDAAMPALVATGRPAGAYANGFRPIPAGFTLGQTVDMLTARSDLDPDAYAEFAMGWIDAGARIVGGCCEIGPAHIATLARRLSEAGRAVVAEPTA